MHALRDRREETTTDRIRSRSQRQRGETKEAQSTARRRTSRLRVEFDGDPNSSRFRTAARTTGLMAIVGARPEENRRASRRRRAKVQHGSDSLAKAKGGGAAGTWRVPTPSRRFPSRFDSRSPGPRGSKFPRLQKPCLNPITLKKPAKPCFDADFSAAAPMRPGTILVSNNPFSTLRIDGGGRVWAESALQGREKFLEVRRQPIEMGFQFRHRPLQGERTT